MAAVTSKNRGPSASRQEEHYIETIELESYTMPDISS